MPRDQPSQTSPSRSRCRVNREPGEPNKATIRRRQQRWKRTVSFFFRRTIIYKISFNKNTNSRGTMRTQANDRSYSVPDVEEESQQRRYFPLPARDERRVGFSGFVVSQFCDHHQWEQCFDHRPLVQRKSTGTDGQLADEAPRTPPSALCMPSLIGRSIPVVGS